MMNVKQVALLIFCTLGIYAAYLTQGIMSERLSTKRYGEQQERLMHLEALSAAQSLVCFVWAFLLLKLWSHASGGVPESSCPPWQLYWRPGITNALGPAFGMIALKNISYPAMVLAKSCKMVPVMLVGSFLHGMHYSIAEYACMLLIGGGVGLFASNTSRVVTSKLTSYNPYVGYGLCAANMFFDGYTSACQDAINRSYPKNTPLHMMCWINFWTALYNLTFMFLLSPIGLEFCQFAARHPDAFKDILLFCVCGAMGQIFIFLNIKIFGSLVTTLVCTSRKFFNILLSVLYNGNPLLPMQWIAVGMVFTGLTSSSLLKSVKAKRH